MQLKLNSDLGEGVGNDALLMPYLFACNIACGGHFGDASTIQTAVKLALKHQVKIGAHPSYPDKENFGRKSIQFEPEFLEKSLQDQLQLFNKILLDCNSSLHHIKAHGALYNDIAQNKTLAHIYLSAMAVYKNKCCFFVPEMIHTQQVTSINGKKIPVQAETFCIHSDHKNAVAITRKLYDTFNKKEDCH